MLLTENREKNSPSTYKGIMLSKKLILIRFYFIFLLLHIS